VTLVALLGVSVFASRAFRQFYLEQTEEDLAARARLVARQVSGRLHQLDDAYCRGLSGESATRVTVIHPGGLVLGDSDEESTKMDNHADRPEIMEALAGRTGSSVRFSHTLQHHMMYVAIPLDESGETVAVVRTSVPLQSIGEALGGIYWQVALGTLVVAGVAAGISLIISRRMSRPLQEMKTGAERFAAGDFEHRLVLPESEEMSALAESMNRMATDLDSRIRAVTRQKNEREAILTSMVEGVVAVDADERLISMNRAAAEMLGVERGRVEDRAIQEAVRNSELQDFVAGILSGSGPAERDLTLTGDAEKHLQVHGAALHDTEGSHIGAVVVLNDVTHLRRLEKVRQEFVANVSHKLRTPLTSIKRFVETLRDGATKEPEKAGHFLGIIARQADRLNAIIEDLLLLASVEEDAGAGGPALEEADLCKVLREAVEDCTHAASEHEVRVEVECDTGLAFRMNPLLVEQAVANLVDNAIKYSDAGGTVRVVAKRREGSVEIAVSDQGIGIEPDKLPRLFERFYRVDKTRSRKLGGTGLGLAIVKHIAEAHGGTVSVESTPGEGSTFMISLPVGR
jgi:two-component system phosphate regulon sensor histidine kinase PhoR